MNKAVLSSIFLLLTTACTSSFHETHFFKSEVRGGAIPNYYRLTVEGSAGLTSSRYLSGYFDEDTVNTYFNEYTQPKGAAILPNRKASDPSTAASGSQVEPVKSGIKGQKLIMILSSNSDAVASQLGALAANKQFAASLGGLLAGGKFVSADEAEHRLALEKSRGKVTSALASQLVGGIPDKASVDETEQRLLSFVNTLAAELGYEGAFSDLEKASLWLETNRARLLRGER